MFALSQFSRETTRGVAFALRFLLLFPGFSCSPFVRSFLPWHSFFKNHPNIINTCKYGCLWCPIFLHFRSLILQIFQVIRSYLEQLAIWFLLSPFILLICTLRSGFEGGRGVVLQTQIFFWVSNQKKIRICRSTFLQPEKRCVFYGSATTKKSKFSQPLFSNLKKNLRLQNHFSATLKMSSKGAD